MTFSGQKIDRIALVHEEPVDASRLIIDAHHHLWDEGQGLLGNAAYLHQHLLTDISTHNVVGTIYVESGAGSYKEGPEALRPVGETAFASEEALRSATSRTPILGIVSFADLTLGDCVQSVIDAHASAGNGLFRGIRHRCGRDPSTTGDGAPDLLTDPAFRDGIERLGLNGLTFDAFVFHPQLTELTRLAQSAPGTSFVLNHLGIPLNRGGRATRDEVMEIWRAGMLALSRCENVFIKIGGIGMESLFGTEWSKRELPPTSDEIAEWWRRDINWCIDTFSPSRCMFESNFPIDRRTMSYTVLWNAFQKIAAGYNDDEQDSLFSGTAQCAYRLEFKKP